MHLKFGANTCVYDGSEYQCYLLWFEAQRHYTRVWTDFKFLTRSVYASFSLPAKSNLNLGTR